MTFSIFSDLKGYQKFAVSMTSALVVAVSVYIVLFKLISFDGAFNTQAAINLYQKGTLTLNYRSNLALQTLLPFQIVNGFFLTIFGNTFLAANLANIFFYLLLFGLFAFLTCIYKSSLPLLAFSCMSLTPAFLTYGFGGYGEIPALTFGLIGVSCLVFKKNSYMANILAGILIACAISTKWVLFLILPPVFLTLFFLKPEKKKLLYFFSAIIFTFVIVSFLQFSHFEPGEMEKLSQLLVKQNTPHYGSEYIPQKIHDLKTYGLRLSQIWNAYSSFSFGFFGPVKIGLTFIIFFVAIYILIRRRERLESTNIFFIFLACFLLVYLFWAFTLNSRWPERRMLNTDVLFYMGIGLLPGAARFANIGRLAVFGFLSIFFGINTMFFFGYTGKNHLTKVTVYESQMKEGLKLLPKNYSGFGQGHLEAPHWSFLAKKDFNDLLQNSVFYDCIENGCNNYLFLQPTNPLDAAQLNFVQEIFKLKEVFNFRGFQIERIEGFNSHWKIYVEQIDFTEKRVENSISNIHERTRDKMYSPPHFEFNEMAVFLDNKRGNPLIEVVFTAHKCHEGKNLKVALINNMEKHIRNFTVTQGENKIEISLPKKFRKSNIDLYLLLEKELRSKDSHCVAQNINRIPLEYKIVQLIAKPAIFR